MLEKTFDGQKHAINTFFKVYNVSGNMVKCYKICRRVEAQDTAINTFIRFVENDLITPISQRILLNGV
jgi:hypothetical protein